jgi:integrase
VSHFNGLSQSRRSQTFDSHHLGAIFSWAVKKKLCAANPVSSVEKPADVKRTRRLSNLEYQQMGAAINGGVISDIFLMLMITGWRSSEVRLLKYSELDLERSIARLGDTKTGASVRPLSSASIEIIKRQQATSEYVFAYQNDKLASTLEAHWKRLNMPTDVTPHVLRHSFASLAADLGFSDTVIAGMLGHSRSSITSRYIHLEKALIEASDAVANETLKLMRL